MVPRSAGRVRRRRTARRARPERSGATTSKNSLPASVPFVATGGRPHRQPAVRTFVVVELEVPGKLRVKRMPIGVAAEIKVLVFHAAPQTFDGRGPRVENPMGAPPR